MQDDPGRGDPDVPPVAVRDLRRTDTHVTICYRDIGAGPTVIMLHGTTATLGVWEPIAARTATHARVVAMDQRGHGRSDKPERGYAATDFCCDLYTVIAELDCAPAVIVGHSLGARNAVVFAATYPALVAGVVAVDYTPYVESTALDELEARIHDGDRSFASLTDIADYIRARYPLMGEDAVQRRVEYGYHRCGDGYRPLADPNAMARTVAGLRDDFDEEMRAVKQPLTIMRGEHSRIVSPTALERTRSDRPDAREVTVPDADHYLAEVAPAPVYAEIARMLSAVA